MIPTELPNNKAIGVNIKDLIVVNDIVDYILETEGDDFMENPDRSHIYYKAVIVRAGTEGAENALSEALLELGEA